jgi:hypothetical protein
MFLRLSQGRAWNYSVLYFLLVRGSYHDIQWHKRPCFLGAASQRAPRSWDHASPFLKAPRLSSEKGKAPLNHDGGWHCDKLISPRRVIGSSVRGILPHDSLGDPCTLRRRGCSQVPPPSSFKEGDQEAHKGLGTVTTVEFTLISSTVAYRTAL